MKRLVVLLALIVMAGCETPPPTPVPGQKWSDWDRKDFYSGDQGSRIMRSSWMLALKQPNGQPFLGDRLARYGYLPNNVDPTASLPIGFTTNGAGPDEAIGMTCAACHTRDIIADGKRHRIDGGPALVDFESFLLDLNAAVTSVVQDPLAFDAFAASVLKDAVTPASKAALFKEVSVWNGRFSTLMDISVMQPRAQRQAAVWGPGRLDAVSMIFNRLTGLDISPAGRDAMLPGNMYPADAPVRYPFLWGSPRQDKTQWPGFAPNGDYLLGLIRNVGEVYGVFADFHPTPNPSSLTKVDYVSVNSANIKGLKKLEELLVKLAPPLFPGPIDKQLAAQGAALFGTSEEKPGQCWNCHGERQGIRRLFNAQTWDTPLQDVGTDSHQYSLLTREVNTGTMKGSGLFPIIKPLPERTTAIATLSTAVTLSILQKTVHFVPGAVDPSAAALTGEEDLATVRAPQDRSLRERILGRSRLAEGLTQVNPPPQNDGKPYKYEARVLSGIWAAAPYLHNGSVPTLADLLEPPERRPVSFKVGSNYDLNKVGLAADQTQFTTEIRTTGCDQRGSGNSRCGHDYGAATLTPDQKRALLEYLKQL